MPEIIYKLRIAFSDDSLSWHKLDKDLIPDKIGIDEAQACPDIFLSNGIYHMFFCYRHGLIFVLILRGAIKLVMHIPRILLLGLVMIPKLILMYPREVGTLK